MRAQRHIKWVLASMLLWGEFSRHPWIPDKQLLHCLGTPEDTIVSLIRGLSINDLTFGFISRPDSPSLEDPLHLL